MKQIQLKILLLTSICITSMYTCASDDHSSTSSYGTYGAVPYSRLPDAPQVLKQYLDKLQAIVDHGNAVLTASEWTDIEEDGNSQKPRGFIADCCDDVVRTSSATLLDTFGASYTPNYGSAINVSDHAHTMKTSVPQSLLTHAPSPELSYSMWAKQAFKPLSLSNPLVGVAAGLAVGAIKRTKLLSSKLTSFLGILAQGHVYVTGYHQLRQLHTIATIKNPSLLAYEADTMKKLMHGMAACQATAKRLTAQRRTTDV